MNTSDLRGVLGHTSPPVASIRVIATDLDGTLLRTDGTVSPYSTAVLTEAQNLGLDIVFATARPKVAAIKVAERIAPNSTIICSNGAVVYDQESGHTPRTLVMRIDTVRQIVRYVRNSFPKAVMAVDCTPPREIDPSRTIDPDWPSEWGSVAAGRSLWRMDESLPPPSSVLCLLVLDAWRTSHEVPQIWRASITSSEDGLIEFSAPSANKLSALRWVCERRDISLNSVVAFGDMPNDVDVLKASGMGVAVANAHERVAAAANFITDSNNEDGVARFVAGLLASRRIPATS